MQSFFIEFSSPLEVCMHCIYLFSYLSFPVICQEHGLFSLSIVRRFLSQMTILFPALNDFISQLLVINLHLEELALNYLTIKFLQIFLNKIAIQAVVDHLINQLLGVLGIQECNQFVKERNDYIKFGLWRQFQPTVCCLSFNFKLQSVLLIQVMIKIFRNNNKLSILFTYLIGNRISVYEGISPSLLATMSLSQGVKGKTNEQLIDSLIKSNIIRNKKLQAAMKGIDRKHFITGGLRNNESYYQNKPYKISGGQNMTDIFTHAVILQQTCFRLQQLMAEKHKDMNKDLKVLDIGTGHGYLAFVISNFINQTQKINKYNLNHEVIGIDLNKKAIQYCQTLKEKLSNYKQEFQRVNFHHQSIQQRLKRQQPYDLIIGGFYMPPSLNEDLSKRLENSYKKTNQNKYGIWASDSLSGQSLYTFSCKNQNQGFKIVKNQIMSTMFSMPVVKTGVSKYFIDEGQQHQNEQSIYQVENNDKSQQISRQRLNIQKIERKKEQKQKLKQELKQRITYYSTKMNKKLSLQQMRKIPEIRSIIQRLNQK